MNKSIELGTGVVYFVYPTEGATENNSFTISEYRFQQDVVLKQNIGSLRISTRLQLDERWIHNSDSEGLTADTKFDLRLRYRLQFDYILWTKKKQYFMAILNDELMFNIGHNVTYNTFDQNRIYIAGQMAFNPTFFLELGYMKAFQQRTTGYEYLNRDTIRITLYQKLDL